MLIEVGIKIKFILNKYEDGVIATNLTGFAVAFKNSLINLPLALYPEGKIRDIEAVKHLLIFYVARRNGSDAVVGQILPSVIKQVGIIKELLGRIIREVPAFTLEAGLCISLKKLVADNPPIGAFPAFQGQRFKHLSSIPSTLLRTGFKTDLNLSQPFGVFND